tara:strand:- start:409 stop:1347 length:939 start_codon:yes stop_codon:yes gene_type:complete
MASNLRVDSIVPATSGNVSIGTATGGVTIPGDLGIAGVLTYEDVTNIDSVGVITARSGINISSGSLTIPDSIIHSGDTNTKIRFPEADAVTIETNGSERLRINSAGSWGIGANFGTSGQVLTSQGNSSAPTWATPSSGGMTLLHTMNINMTANTQSQSLNLTGYVKLMGLITGVSRSGGVNDTWLSFNGMNSSGSYSWVRSYLDNSNDTSTNRSGTSTGYAYGSVGPGFFLNLAGIAAADDGNLDAEFTVHNLQESGRKIFTMTSRSYLVRNIVIDTRGSINTTSAITSFAINVSNSVSRNTGGTIKLYGVK